MKDTELFQIALGLLEPWQVVSSEFDVEIGLLSIRLDFKAGAKFSCPECEAAGPTHDTVEKRWRHLNFFQHKTELIARVPRVKCPKCGVRQVQVPWARPDSGFTALFEAFCMTLAKDMPITKIADLVEEYDTRIWRIVRHHVSEAREREDYSGVKEVGVDETSARKGHNYITIFVDMAKAKVIFATPGKDGGTFKDFKEDFVSCINGLIQTVKRRARGFRNMENFIAMIYLQCGKLKLSPLPT